jgi:hypothetical protein
MADQAGLDPVAFDWFVLHISAKPLPRGREIAGARQHLTSLGLRRRQVCRARPCLDDGRVFRQIGETVAGDQPTQALLIDPGKRPVSIATENIERPPAELIRLFGDPAVEEAADVVNELLPAPRRHVGGRVVGIEPREAFGLGARDTGIVFDDRGAFFRARGRCMFDFFVTMAAAVATLMFSRILRQPYFSGVVTLVTTSASGAALENHSDLP